MTVPDDTFAYDSGDCQPDVEEVTMGIEVRCLQDGLEESDPSVRRQIEWYRRRIGEMMPVWGAQYREYLDVGFGMREP